jgi:hypothetical protein
VPADFGSKELIWTLTANGKTEKAYASLKSGLPDRSAGDSRRKVGGDFGSLRDELRWQHSTRADRRGDEA